ncbi:Crp/Fnr family transcriptional regulator [Ideonella sp. A 288]|uniref:Crp/Fnr family transcriptional regulator n=1 Tax=Ideonella sp. A 288 TaxID=1962181 RepID=UPI001303BE8A|nr:Crp/Fnr family transcriptional regulator [Ideonella sp. A 288]
MLDQMRGATRTHEPPVNPAADYAAVRHADPRDARALPEAVAGLPESLALVAQHLTFAPRTVQRGRPIQRAGEAFRCLHLIRTGAAKAVADSPDGRRQIVGLHFGGDWIGLDSMATGRCAADTVALDRCEVWSVLYTALVAASAEVPALTHVVHVAMSAQLLRERTWRLALGTLAPSARLAEFILGWRRSADAPLGPGEAIRLGLSRPEIGDCLGLSRETVCRAFGHLKDLGLVRPGSGGPRHLLIPDLDALGHHASSTPRRRPAASPRVINHGPRTGLPRTPCATSPSPSPCSPSPC